MTLKEFFKNLKQKTMDSTACENAVHPDTSREMECCEEKLSGRDAILAHVSAHGVVDKDSPAFEESAPNDAADQSEEGTVKKDAPVQRNDSARDSSGNASFDPFDDDDSLTPEQAYILSYIEEHGFFGAGKEEFCSEGSAAASRKNAVYHRGKAMEQRIDLHGMTVDEADAAVRKAFDEAFSRGVTQLLVIHGRGNHGGARGGAVREHIRALIRRDLSHRVDDYKYASGGEGGSGATRIYLSRGK
ncbi:MAG: Smr/MutS family protein [Fibrobacterota bacterium]